uniref:tRNA (guanine(46)-N(7))-methyltransferase n=1 Tax=Arcella intermedia TaxID=1963864 RepID=A0A6B2L428_9EUKA
MVNALVRGGLLQEALNIVQEMKSNGIPPNTVTYTAVIKGFSGNGNVKEAVQILNDMEGGETLPNLRTYNTVLRGCVQAGDYGEAQNIMNKLSQHNLQKDHSTVLSLLKLHVQQMQIKEAWSDFQELLNFPITIEPTIYTLLATGAALAKEEAITKEVLDKLSKRNDLTPLILREIQTIQSYKAKAVPNPQKTDRLYRWSEGHAVNWSLIPKGPVNMEICSGLGEWVINRCKKEQDKNWISLEQRYDRVLQTWSKMELQKITNLFVCCGEASAILKQDCFKNKLDAIFVNFPDPPHNEENNRLFNADFIKLVHQVLKAQGTIEVLTDDKHYYNIITREFTSSNLFSEHPTQNSNDPTYFDELEKSVGRTERFSTAFKKRN